MVAKVKKKKPKTTQMYDGEWYYFARKNHAFQCCDCDLIHDMEFKIVNNRIYMRVWRAD